MVQAQRWLPQGSNVPGPGAVSRPGIGAIHPSTGLALSWNPTKERGVRMNMLGYFGASWPSLCSALRSG